MRFYKFYSLCLALVFSVVGLTFLFFPNKVLKFFNTISAQLGFDEAPLHGMSFFLTLAVSYMYLVTLLAILMYKNPLKIIYPTLMVHAKLASSILSLYLFISEQHYLIFITNCIVDGLIGISIIYLIKRRRTGYSRLA